jgi:hypothetical protein
MPFENIKKRVFGRQLFCVVHISKRYTQSRRHTEESILGNLLSFEQTRTVSMHEFVE